MDELDYLQGEARRVETAVTTDWAFQDVLLLLFTDGGTIAAHTGDVLAYWDE